MRSPYKPQLVCIFTHFGCRVLEFTFCEGNTLHCHRWVIAPTYIRYAYPMETAAGESIHPGTCLIDQHPLQTREAKEAPMGLKLAINWFLFPIMV
jgi:hypothetical protein